MAKKKITAFCPTLNRPELLGRMIKCFENQTYENRELIILDDGGQYENQKGDRWELVSVPRRFRTLGEKNNAVLALASFDSEAILKADDDDIYMPWWFESMAEALDRAEMIQPDYAIDFINGNWVQVTTHCAKSGRGAYHGCWGYRRSFIEKIGGYRAQYAGDDQELDRRVRREGTIPRSIDHSKFPPFYWYNRPLPGRISERGGSESAYVATGRSVSYVGKVPEWKGEEVWKRAIPETKIVRPW